MRNLKQIFAILFSLFLCLMTAKAVADPTPAVDITMRITPMMDQSGSTVEQKAVDHLITLPYQLVPKQTLYLDVTIWTTTWFAKPITYPEWQIRGALVLPSTEPSFPLTRQYEGQSWSGVQRRFLLIPEKVGDLILQPVNFTIYPAQTVDPLMISSPAFKMSVSLPRNDKQKNEQAIDRFIPSDHLTIDQHFQLDVAQTDPTVTKTTETETATGTTESNAEQTGVTSPIHLTVGDTLERTITLTAPQLLSHYLPQWQSTAPQGMVIYQQPPQSSNLTEDRGVFTGGQRIEHFNYTVQQAGEYQLDAIKLTWWDISLKQWQESTLPAITIIAKASSYTGTEQTLQPTAWQYLLQSRWFIKTVGLSFTLLVLCYLSRHWLWEQLCHIKAQCCSYYIRSVQSEWFHYQKLYWSLTLPLVSEQTRLNCYQSWRQSFQDPSNQDQEKHYVKTALERAWLQFYYGEQNNVQNDRQKTHNVKRRELRQLITQQHAERKREQKGQRYGLPPLN